MKALGIIPARYASTRFPGKPLIDLGGKSMIQRVYERALLAKSLAKVYVATDDERIFDHVLTFGGNAIMTDVHHQSGTDRCAEAAMQINLHFMLDTISEKLEKNQSPQFAPIADFDAPREGIYDAIVNIQGDEPFIAPEQIDAVIEVLKDGAVAGFKIATLAQRIENQGLIENPNVVKVVFDAQKRALYFSRSPIPHLRDTPQYEWHKTGHFYKHIGIYAYRMSALKAISDLAPSHLEMLEKLEQLRWLENGYGIGVGITDIESIGIDTPEDIEKVRHLFT